MTRSGELYDRDLEDVVRRSKRALDAAAEAAQRDGPRAADLAARTRSVGGETSGRHQDATGTATTLPR